MRSRDLSRKTQTKKGEARQLPLLASDVREREEVVLCFAWLSGICPAAALLGLLCPRRAQARPRFCCACWLRLLNSALLLSESQGAAVTVESQRIFNSVGDREGEADALRMQAAALCVGCNRLGR